MRPGATRASAPTRHATMRAAALRVARAVAAPSVVAASPRPSASSSFAFWRENQIVNARREVATRAAPTRDDALSPSASSSADADADADADARAVAAAAAVEETLSRAPGSAFETTEYDRAKAQILRFLNYKPRTRAELMTTLVEDKLYDPDVAAGAIDYLQSKGVHSDVDYAEQWGRYKWRTAKWAPWRIKRSLAEKGVDWRDATEGLSRVFDDLGEVKLSAGEDGDGDGDGDATRAVVAGEEEDKGAELLRAARRRWTLTRGMPSQTRRRRMSAWLERRGHRFGVVRDIVETLEGEDAAREAEEAEEFDAD